MQTEDYGDQVVKGRQQQQQINTFWRTKKNAAEMDEVYHGLLRSGKSTVKRHYELTGKLADEEARQNPQYARIQALLALPTDEEDDAQPQAQSALNTDPAAAGDTSAAKAKAATSVLSSPAAK